MSLRKMVPSGQGRGAVSLDGVLDRVLVPRGCHPRVSEMRFPKPVTEAAQVGREARLQQDVNAACLRVGNRLVQQARVGATVRLPPFEQGARPQSWSHGASKVTSHDDGTTKGTTNGAGLAEPRIDVSGEHDEQDLGNHPAENGQHNHFADAPLHGQLAVCRGLTAVVARRYGHEVVLLPEHSSGQLLVTTPGGKIVARLLAPQLRTYCLRRLSRRGLDKHGYMKSTRGWVTSFAAGTELVGRVIKVSGAMRAIPAVDNGRRVLRIHFNFLFVYPVQRPDQPVTRMRIVVRTEGNADFAQWDDPAGPLQVWWFPGPGSGAAGSRCDVHDGFVHP